MPRAHMALSALAAIIPLFGSSCCSPGAREKPGAGKASLVRTSQGQGLGDVIDVKRHGDELDLTLASAEATDHLHVVLLASDVVNVEYRPHGQAEAPSFIVDPDAHWPAGPHAVEVQTESDPIVLRTERLRVEIAAHPARVAVFDSEGQLLLRERAAEGIHPRGVRFDRAAGEPLYGMAGIALPADEGRQDPKVSMTDNLLRNRGARVQAGAQGNGGAPLAFTARYGVVVDSVDGEFDATESELSFSGASREATSFYVVAGGPKDTLGATATLSGHAPMLPKWALGFANSEWGTDQNEVTRIVDDYRARGIGLDAFILDFDFKAWGEDNFGEFRWNSTSNPGNVHPNKFPDGASGQFARALAAKGVALVGIMKPRIIVETVDHEPSQQAMEAGNLDCFYPGQEPYPEYFSGRLARDIDFAEGRCRSFYWTHAKPLFDTGIVAWWNDEADATGDFMFHSLQHANMQRALYEGQRSASDARVYSLNRNFYLGAQRYAYATWTGDIVVGDKDGPHAFATMREQRQRMLTLVNIGQARPTMDTGGFWGTPTPQAYARWMQFAALTPIMRVHGALNEQRQPWVYGPIAERAAADAIALRHRLVPYLYACERTLYETGIGMMRPLVYDYPTDPKAINDVAEWMLGDSLLARPVLEEDATSVDVYLPAGSRWVDYFRGTVHQGGQTLRYEVNAHNWRDIPLFIKEGAILPSTPGVLDVYPSSHETSFTVYEDDGATYAYEGDAFFRQTLSVHADGRKVTVEGKPATGSKAPGFTSYLLRVHDPLDLHTVREVRMAAATPASVHVDFTKRR
ncbi:DUF5110 domain-containing protein [Pendulispora rubella]|uniref:DUF5110 domain-containing protein n=1 Tax=Pendulispora rubella TaxID=2741070 RepID=A0ABZ2L9U4_9BACT